MNVIINENHPLYKKAFQNVFTALQLSSAYVLYYDLDWSKDDVVEYQGLLTAVDKKSRSYDPSVTKIIETLKTEISFDCFRENDKLPYRTKIKMCQLKYKPKQTFMVGAAADNSAGEHLALASYTLWKYYNSNKENIEDWYNHLIEFCKLYTTGMTDKHILQYFVQECDLYIQED